MVVNCTDHEGKVTITARDTLGQTLVQLNHLPISANGFISFDDFFASNRVENAFGPLEVTAEDDIRVLASSRVFSSSGTGSFFQAIDVDAASRSLILPYVADTTQYRTNLGLHNTGPLPANVEVTFVDVQGISMQHLTTEIPSSGLGQLNNVVRQLLGTSSLSNAEGSLQITSDQPLIAWTSQIRNATDDPGFVIAKPGGNTHLLLPSVVNSETFVSSLVIRNVAAEALTVTLIARGADGAQRTSVSTNIPKAGVLTLADVLGFLKLPNTFGPLEIVATGDVLAVSAVTSNKGTGAFFEGQILSE